MGRERHVVRARGLLLAACMGVCLCAGFGVNAYHLLHAPCGGRPCVDTGMATAGDLFGTW